MYFVQEVTELNAFVIVMDKGTPLDIVQILTISQITFYGL